MAKRATSAKKLPKKKAKKVAGRPAYEFADGPKEKAGEKRVSFSERAGQVVLKGDLKEENPTPKDPWTPTKQTRRDY